MTINFAAHWGCERQYRDKAQTVLTLPDNVFCNAGETCIGSSPFW